MEEGFFPCAVEVCERYQSSGQGCVCHKCADMSWNLGDKDEQGNKLCDLCNDGQTIGDIVVGGECSADYICEPCYLKWHAD